jgi:predicted Zn finger-like uncharacterized protein
MKFVCERCHTKYSIADDKVRQKILKIRCKTCENVITIRDAVVVHEPRAMSEPRGVRAVPPAPPPRAPRAVEWHLAIDGRQEGPVGLPVLISRIQAAPRTAEIYVWNEHLDGWKEPKFVPEVAAELRGRVAPPPPPPVPIGGGKRVPTAARPTVSSSSLPAAQPAPISTIASGRRSGSHGTVDHPVSAKSGAMPAVSGAVPRASANMPAVQPTAFGGTESESERTQVDSGMRLGDLAGQAAVAKQTAFAPLPAEHPPGVHPSRSSSGALPKMNGAPAAGGGSVSGLESLDFVPGAGGRSSGSHPILGVSSGGHPMLHPKPADRLGDPGLNMASPPGAVASPVMGGATAALLIQAGVRAARPRHPAFKFVVTGGLLVGLIIVVAVLAMSDRDRGGGVGKPALAGATPTAAPEAEARARAEAEKVFKSMVGEKTPPSQPVASTRSITPPPVRRGSARKGGGQQQDAVTPPPVAPPPLAGGGTPVPDGVGVSRRFAQDERKVSAPGKERGGSRGGGQFDLQKFMGVFKQQDHHTAIKSCYERALKRDERLKLARLEIAVNVGETGSVKRVRVEAPPEFSGVSTCIRDAVRRWRFPSNNEEYEASFPLILHGNAE